MQIVNPSIEVRPFMDWTDLCKHIEKCGRECYKSEAYTTEDSYAKFIRNLIKNGHESVLEHGSFSVKFICDRGVSHEIVRHRLAAFSQESTRYCNYSKEKFGNEITVVRPFFFKEGSYAYIEWKQACMRAEEAYMNMLSDGVPAEQARTVLPNSLKTELIMTADIREWRHFLKLRTAPAAHPQMREVALMLLNHLNEKCPCLFEDIV